MTWLGDLKFVERIKRMRPTIRWPSQTAECDSSCTWPCTGKQKSTKEMHWKGVKQNRICTEWWWEMWRKKKRGRGGRVGVLVFRVAKNPKKLPKEWSVWKGVQRKWGAVVKETKLHKLGWRRNDLSKEENLGDELKTIWPKNLSTAKVFQANLNKLNAASTQLMYTLACRNDWSSTDPRRRLFRLKAKLYKIARWLESKLRMRV